MYEKIAKVQGEIGKLSKDADNPYFKSGYLTLEKLLDNLRPLLEKHKLVLTQCPSAIIDNGNTVGILKTVITDLENEEQLETEMLLASKATDPQAQGSAITYARRYALMAIFAIVPSETDDDGNAASPAPIEKAMTPTQLVELGKIMADKGIVSQDDKKTLIRALAGNKPLNTSALERLKKQLEEAQADTLREIILSEEQ